MKFTPRGEFPRQRPLLASPLVLLSGEELIITEFPRQRPLLASPLVLLSGEQLGFVVGVATCYQLPGSFLARVAGPGHSVPRQGLPAQRYPALQALRVQWIEPQCR